MTQPDTRPLIDTGPNLTDRFINEVTVKFGACVESLDYFKTHTWEDMLKKDIPEPYPAMWGYWSFMNLAHRASRNVRAILLAAACKDPFYAAQVWLHADHMTPEEERFAYRIASTEYSEFRQQAEAGLITPGCQASEWKKPVEQGNG